MVEWLSYGLEIILIAIGALFTVFGLVIVYRYKKTDKQTTEEQQDTENWYADAVECTQRIQQIEKNWMKNRKERNIPQFQETQRKMKILAENLSSHHTKGEILDIDNKILSLLEETAEKCREVVRVNTDFKDAGISSELNAANESAEELEQNAKTRL